MDFHEKLQLLRKSKDLTQEELAAALYVSRAAVSKWESGRGYPNIDSLKAIAVLFSVTIDELLSGEELLSLAEEDHKQKENKFSNLVFGLLDLSHLLLLVLPFFARRTETAVTAVSLLSLRGIAVYLYLAYYAFIMGSAVSGGLFLIQRNRPRVSILLSAAGTCLFIMSLQPYAAIFSFVLLAINELLMIRNVSRR